MEPNTNATPAPAAPPPAAGSKDERMWAMFCHLAALSGGIIPLGTFVGPLIIWLIKRDEYPLVKEQGREALNFQLTMLIGFLICIPLIFACGIGAFLALVLGIVDLVFVIIAAIKTNEGVAYRYPFRIQFLH